jgi:hypothetical protein
LSTADNRLTVHVTSSDGLIDEIDPANKPIVLGARPRAATFTVELLNVTGAPISDKVAVETHTGCNENVVVVEFVQNHAY